MRQSFVIVILSCIFAGCAKPPVMRELRADSCLAPSPNLGNVGNTINSRADDYAPQCFDGTLIFSSAVNTVPEKYPKALRSELWMSRHSGPIDSHNLNADWSQPQKLVPPLKGIDLDLNEGSMSIIPEQHKAIFAAERIINEKTKEVSPLMDLYEVTIGDDLKPTSEPKQLDDVNDPDAWDSQPALSSDGKTLFFVSDRPDAGAKERGNMHIYRSTWTNSAWSKPIRLPAPYSTSGNDVTPFVGTDGWFYFSSDGNPDSNPAPAGLGKRDIFRVKLSGDSLAGTPIRLPAPYNSEADDDFPFVTRDGSTMWLASTRPGGCGDGDRDIYAFPIVPKIQLCATAMQIHSNNGVRDSAHLNTTLILHDREAEATTDGSLITADTGCTFLLPGHKYTVTLPGKNCSDPIVHQMVARSPFNRWHDTTYYESFSIEPRELDVTLGKNDTIPWFIVGYWKPNTPTNFTEFIDRMHAGYFDSLQRANEFNAASYIRFGGPPLNRDDCYSLRKYDSVSAIIEGTLSQRIYDPVLHQFIPELKKCSNDRSVLTIKVNGYTDNSTITSEKNYLDSSVEIKNGKLLQEPSGIQQVVSQGTRLGSNDRLSIVRAYWALRTIRDQLLMDNDFRALDSQGRIVYKFEGHGMDPEAKNDDCGKGFNRRIDVDIKIVSMEAN